MTGEMHRGRCGMSIVYQLSRSFMSPTKTLLRSLLPIAAFTFSCFIHAEEPATAATAPALPFKIERFAFPGPVAGVLARIDLTDARVHLKVALSDDRDPDGDGPCVGRLDTTSSAARRYDFAVAVNAGFFAEPPKRAFAGKELNYVVGNCALPVGWHFAEGKSIKPSSKYARAVLVVHNDGKITLHDEMADMPADARYAVGGSAVVLRDGMNVADVKNTARHPRTAVGVSADQRTLLLVTVDGRQESSRGVTLVELSDLMQKLGAQQALNLDGGGSSTLVVKDPATGVYAIANHPSDKAFATPEVNVERPVADVLGITLK